MRCAAILLALALVGCELQEVAVVEIEDVIVAEAYAFAGVAPPGTTTEGRLWVFLGRTVGGSAPTTVEGAQVDVTRSDDTRFVLAAAPLDRCLLDTERPRPGSCYDAGAAAAQLSPGDRLDLEIRLPDGRTLEGSTRIPGDFSLVGDPSVCSLPPDTPIDVRWSRSAGASAYVAETRIEGLEAALAPEGIEAPDDLYLLGLSVSQADTTIVFPGEFGIFDRFDLDQALTVRLQRGLPEPTRAVVGVTAVDINYVNWARGGNFNPSGQVRVPSVRGDGSGVFASGVLRSFTVQVEGAGPACPGIP